MTTTEARMLPAPVRRTREQRITDAVRRATDTDGTIDDALTLLALVGTASVAELAGGDGPGAVFDALARAQTLCHVVGVALRRFDADIRCAAPAVLIDVVKDARQNCGNRGGCSEWILPWTYDGTFCSPECRNADMRAHGETWTD